MPKRLRILIVVAVVATAVIVWILRHRQERDPNQLRVSGNIEVTQVDLAFKIPGRLLERLVDEGQTVAAGQTVARLDAADQEARLAKAEADVDYTRAALKELEAGSRPEEIAQAAAQLEQARAAARAAQSRLELARSDLDRYQALLRDKVISQREFDEIQTRYKTASDAQGETAAQVRRAKSAWELVRRGPRRETIDQARARLQAAEQSLALARQQLQDTVVKAPFGGVVLSKSAEPGAFLNPGSPVVTLGRMDQVWLRAFVNETDLGRIRLDQPAEVRTDTYPDRVYPGRISYISDQAEFTPKAVQTYEERVKLMYRIKIALNNPRQELKPGMPADARIQVQP